LCLSLAKQLLGVNNKASNMPYMAVRGELGLYPMYIDIVVRMCSYWKRLDSMSDNSLLNSALQEHINIGGSWIACVRTLLDKCGMDIQDSYSSHVS
jgi:hypothetical protein